MLLEETVVFPSWLEHEKHTGSRVTVSCMGDFDLAAD